MKTKFESNHTPTPWYESTVGWNDKAVTGYGGKVVFGRINMPTDEEKANAAFIVRAVNSHEEMLDALKQLASIANEKGLDRDVRKQIVAQAWAAIAKAEGEKP